MPRAEPALLLCSRSLARAPRGLLSAAAASGGAAAAGAGAAPTMSGEEEAAELTIAEDLVVTKYKMGGDIANRECRAAGGRGAEGGGGTDGQTDVALGRAGPRGGGGRRPGYPPMAATEGPGAAARIPGVRGGIPGAPRPCGSSLFPPRFLRPGSARRALPARGLRAPRAPGGGGQGPAGLHALSSSRPDLSGSSR